MEIPSSNPLIQNQLYKNRLERFLIDHVQLDLDPERSVQLMKIVKSERYWKGDQYATASLDRRNGTIDWNSGSGYPMLGAQSADDHTTDDVLNFYYGDGLKLVGILGRIPNMKVVANDKRNEQHVRRSEIGNRIIGELGPHWNLETVQPELVASLFKYGTTFGYTPFVLNKKRYGQRQLPRFEERSVQIQDPMYQCSRCDSTSTVEDAQMVGACMQCGTPFGPEDFREAQHANVPEISGWEPFDNGSVEFHLCTAYTVQTPYYVKQFENVPWLRYEYDEHAGILISTYPALRPMRRQIESGMTGGSSSSELGQIARMSAASQTRLYRPSRPNYWRYTRDWLDASMYEMMSGDTEGDKLRDYLLQNYPEGAKLTSIQGHLVKIESESLHEVWKACKPTVSEFLYPESLGFPYIRANDTINDTFNAMKQTVMHGIPLKLFDSDVLDANMMSQHAATPGVYLPVAKAMGKSLRDSIWQEEPAELQSETPKVMELAINSTREIVGVSPSLFGGDSGSQTLGEAELKRNQALMPHNTTWANIRFFYAGCAENAIKQFAKYSGGTLNFQKGTGTESVEIPDIEDVLNGGWHVECDEAIPMTWGQRRAQMWQVVDKGPELWSMIGLQNPENIETLMSLIGSDDFKIPGLDAIRKAMAVIGDLSKGAPVVMPPMMPGTMPDIQPSIPADEFEDDHNFMVQVVKEWAQSESARRLRAANPDGYANVIAWGKAHFQMAQAMMMPPVGPDGQPAAPPPPPGQPQPMGNNLAAPPPPGAPVLPPASEPTPAPEELQAPNFEERGLPIQ